MATGVLMTRFVASEGKREMMWVRALRALEETHGTEVGRAIFRDFVWQEDAQATTTVLAGEGRFPRTDATPAEREAAFQSMAAFAATLPHDLDRGPGADPDSREPVPGRQRGVRGRRSRAAGDRPALPHGAGRRRTRGLAGGTDRRVVAGVPGTVHDG